MKTNIVDEIVDQLKSKDVVTEYDLKRLTTRIEMIEKRMEQDSDTANMLLLMAACIAIGAIIGLLLRA